MLDYFLPALIATSEQQVLASLAMSVNSGETADALAQAPHHFELWELGTIDDQGNITPTRKLITDASSLVRDGVRHRSSRDTTTARDEGKRGSQAGASPGHAAAGSRNPEDPTQAAHQTPPATATGHRGGFDQARG